MTREYSTIFTLLIVAAVIVAVGSGALSKTTSVAAKATEDNLASSTSCERVDRDGDGSQTWDCPDGKKVYGLLEDCDDYDARLAYARGYCIDGSKLMRCEDGRVKVALCEYGCQQTGDGVTDVCATPVAYPAYRRY